MSTLSKATCHDAEQQFELVVVIFSVLVGRNNPTANMKGIRELLQRKKRNDKSTGTDRSSCASSNKRKACSEATNMCSNKKVDVKQFNPTVFEALVAEFSKLRFKTKPCHCQVRADPETEMAHEGVGDFSKLFGLQEKDVFSIFKEAGLVVMDGRKNIAFQKKGLKKCKSN